MSIRPWFGAQLSVLAACAASCASAPRSPSDPEGGAPLSLPRLRVVACAPILDASGFEGDGRAWRRPLPTGPATDEPHGSDAEAVAAAIDWMVAHFGPLPPETALVAISIDHSAAGSDDPAARVSDPGHTIVLRQTWRGMRTRIVSVVYISGRSRIGGHFELASFEPVAGSEAPTIGAEAAVAAVVAWGRAGGAADEAALARFREQAQPHLEFVYSPRRDEEFDLDPLYFDPAWSFGDDLMVDAYDGAVWRDC